MTEHDNAPTPDPTRTPPDYSLAIFMVVLVFLFFFAPAVLTLAFNDILT